MSERVDLHLRIRVTREKRARFDAFLREAIPFYEAPGGIRVRLVENEQDPTDLLQIIEYATVHAYEKDRRRAATDREMHDHLVRWRDLLDGSPQVVAYVEKPPLPLTSTQAVPRAELRTARLLLRPFGPSDAMLVVELASDRRIAEMTLTVPHPYERHHADAWIASHEALRRAGTGVVLAICEHGGTLVGAVGLEINTLHNRAELGYWIGVSFWGRGYATEAACELVRYGFETLGLNRIVAHRFASNPASGRVLEKAGLLREGLLPQHSRRFGEFHDIVAYGIGNSEWSASRRPEGA